MPLQKGALTIQFAGGVDTQTDAKQVPTTKLADLQNAVFTRKTTLSKRNGYEALSQAIDQQSADYMDATGMGARADEALVFASGRAYSYRPSSDSWVDTGEVSSVVATATPMARTGTVQTMPDAAVRHGIRVVAWEDTKGLEDGNNGVWFSVLEDATERILVPATQLDSAGQHPRCVNCGEVLHVLWARPAAGEIRIATVNPATPESVPTSSVLTSDLKTTLPAFDAQATGDVIDATNRPAVIAWAQNGGGFRVGYIAPSGVLGSPVTGLPSVATFADSIDNAIGVTFDPFASNTIAVVWPQGLTLQGKFLNATTLTTVIRTATLSTHTSAYSKCTAAFGEFDATGIATLFWCAESFGARTDINRVHAGRALRDAGDFDDAHTELLGHCLITRAFADGADDNVPGVHVYACVAHAVQFFPYVAVVRISADAGIGGTGTIQVARLLPGETAGTHWRRLTLSTREQIRHLSGFVEVGISETGQLSRQHAFPLSYRIQLSSENGDQFSEVGIKYAVLDFDNAAAYQTAELGRGLYLASAGPQHYDGSRWTEADYHTAPDIGYDTTGAAVALSTLFTTGNGVGTIPNGTYLYKLWYENIDAQGELHPGPVSVGVLVVLAGANDTVTISAPSYRLTNKRRVRLCAARSEVNQTGDEVTIPLYRTTGTDPGVPSGLNAYVESNPAADTTQITDGMTDAVLITKEPLYTNGGILSNDPAPWKGNAIAVSKSRLFWTDPSDPHLVRFSQQVRDDVGLEAPVDLSIRVDPYGGDIVNVAGLDETIVVYKESALHVFGGPGPDADGGISAPGGQANAFSPAELVTADVGLSAPKSIGQIPTGHVFQSGKGIMLLSRAREVQYLGHDVEAYNAQVITRATLIPDRHHVVFLTSSGSTLLYDYHHDQWSRFTNHEGYDAVVVDGRYYYLRTDGRVFRETPGTYADGTQHIPMLIETAWIKMTGYLQGWQRVHHAMVVGAFKSAHQLRVNYKIDYEESWTPFPDIDVSADYSGSEYGEGSYGVGPFGGSPYNYGTVYQQRLHINKRCQSIAFRFEDHEAADDFGASFELSELLLTGGILRPAFQVGASRSQ